MAKHARPELMYYMSDFPKGQSIVLVYPEFGDIVRWVPYVDQFGYDQHTAETFRIEPKVEVEWGTPQYW